MPDGELLVVGRDPERVASRGREDGPEDGLLTDEPGGEQQDRDQRGGGGGRPGQGREVDAPRSDAPSDEPRNGRRGGQDHAVDSRERGDSHARTGQNKPSGAVVAADSLRCPVDSGESADAEDREAVHDRDEDEHRPGEYRQDAAEHGGLAGSPLFPCDQRGEWDERSTSHDHRKFRGKARGSEHQHRARRQDRRQRHPVTIARNGQHWIGGQAAADLEEAPKRRSGEPLAGRQASRDELVVRRVEVGRVSDDDRSNGPCQERRSTHGEQDAPAHRRSQMADVSS